MWSEGWAPLWTTKPMNKEVESRSVGWHINWCKSWVNGNKSMLEPSNVVTSSCSFLGCRSDYAIAI